jgi:hypothetical protein
MSYSESDEYQSEIAAQYQKRTLQLPLTVVQEIMHRLGFIVPLEDIQLCDTGNMNATFITPDYVVKLSSNPETKRYLTNKLVSERLPDKKVVRVLMHDHFSASDYEVLVMEKASGHSWQRHMSTMSEEANKELFREVLEVVAACKALGVPNKFGWVTDSLSGTDKTEFNNYSERLRVRLHTYVSDIRKMEYLDQEAVEKIVAYVENYLDLFNDDVACFVHSDLHMGNVMHEEGRMTAVIDWDSTHPVPAYVGLMPLVGLIDNPAQFVEGTPYYNEYKGKKFEYLYPLLKIAYLEELQDPQLVRKLNVLGIIENLMWVSGEWSKEWNQEKIAQLTSEELAETDEKLAETYFGKTIGKIKRYALSGPLA